MIQDQEEWEVEKFWTYDKGMGRTDTLLDGKNILKETTHGNLKKIYKMQVKSCRNIFRVYQKQDNFSMELKPREGVML